MFKALMKKQKLLRLMEEHVKIKQILREMKNSFRKLYLRMFDPRRISEVPGARVVFKHLKTQGFLDDLARKRILEIGPKHGMDSLLLANLNPEELVRIDLPEKKSLVSEFLPKVSCVCKLTYLEGNILYLTQEQYAQLGKFDLIWCLGVIYHNVEQIRLLKRLFDLCQVGGSVVIESATTKNKKLKKLNVVEIHWPEGYRHALTVTHLPSRLAIKSWLEMVGFVEVKIGDIYSKHIGWRRAILTGRKTECSNPYVSYKESGLNPPYVVGDAK